MMAPKKKPLATDLYVGNRVRMRRLQLGMSQEALANGLGLTFQQVQKYEKGTNRIGASRLEQIAKLLNVSVVFFFEGANFSEMSPEAVETNSAIQIFLGSREGQSIAMRWAKVRPDAKRIIMLLVDIMAGGDAAKAEKEFEAATGKALTKF